MNFIKKNKKFIFFLTSIFLVFVLFDNSINIILIYSSEKTCSKIIEKKRINNNIGIYTYSYNVDGIMQYSYEPVIHIKRDLNLDSLKKIECIKVEYSSYFPSISKIVDERVLR